MGTYFKVVLARLKAEPVAVYGALASAALVLLGPVFGLSAGTVDLVALVLTVAGVPIVRSQVSPTD